MVSVPDMVAKFVELAGLDKISNKTVDTVRELTEFQDRAEDIGKAVSAFKDKNPSDWTGIWAPIAGVISELAKGSDCDWSEIIKRIIEGVGEVLKIATKPFPIFSAPFGVIDLCVAAGKGVVEAVKKAVDVLQDGEYTLEDDNAVLNAFLGEFVLSYTQGLSQVLVDMFTVEEQVILHDVSHGLIDFDYADIFYNPKGNTKVVIAALNQNKISIRALYANVIIGSYTHASTLWGGANAIISGGSGDDSIRTDGKGTVFGGAGNDVIWASGRIYGDSMIYLDKETIENLDENNVLNNHALKSEMASVGGDDTIHGASGNDMIFGEAGNDILYGEDGNDLLYGGRGNDLLQGDAGGDTLKGGTGNDTLIGGPGNDALYGDSYNDVVNDDNDAGNDVFSYGSGDSLNTAHGNDTIFDYNDGDIIRLLNVAVSSYSTEGNDVIIYVKNSGGNNSITVKNAADKDIVLVDENGKRSTIQASSSEDSEGKSITNDYNDNVTLEGTAGNDTIENKDAFYNYNKFTGKINYYIYEDVGKYVLIRGNGGNDSIESLGRYTTIQGGAGNDTITNTGNNALIEGGANNDYIKNVKTTVYGHNGKVCQNDVGQYVTISGGTGNDTIYNESYNVLFKYGFGDDLIQGFNTTPRRSKLRQVFSMKLSELAEIL